MASTSQGASDNRVVLVTGVSRDLGRRSARALAADPTVDRVIGVDVVPPRGDVGDVSFVRADIRNPVIAKVIAKENVDTVVHMSVISTPGSAGGRGTMKELNVIGTMQLLAACQKAPSVQHLVVKSTTTMYGASNRDPAMFTEDMEPRRGARSGYAKDVAEIEGYVRGFARRRPDVRVTTLRCANVIGPHVVSPLTSYFRLPLIPTVLGFDARLQFLHEQDLMDVLIHAVRTDLPGTFNVAGDGVLMLSQALRRLKRPSVPMPGFAVGGVGSRAAQCPAGGLLSGTAQLPHLRSRGGHHPDARGARLRARVHDRRGVRRLRRGPDAHRRPDREGPHRGARPAAAGRGDPGAPPGGRWSPWVTRRSSRSGPAAGPGAARAAAGRPRPRATWPPAPASRRPAKDGAARAADGPRRARQPRPPSPRCRGDPRPGVRRGADCPPAASRPATGSSAFQHAARELFGDQWEPQLARFLAFLRRRVTGDYVVDEYGFDQEITERFFMTALRPIAQKWFRIEVRGIENIPSEGGALVVSNHSGTIPVDGLMTMVSIHDHTGRFLRPLGADLVFKSPVVSTLARKGGTTLACNEDAERMLRGGELVGVWPEGFKGIGKPYAERYKLQRFGRGGFVSAALRTQVPIIPLSVVGAEEIYPLVANLPSLARVLGLPYLPITPLFPWLGPLGLVPLPSKWLLEFGEPIRTDEFDAGAAEDPMLVFNVTDEVRETIQSTLYSLLMQRQSVFR